MDFRQRVAVIECRTLGLHICNDIWSLFVTRFRQMYLVTYPFRASLIGEARLRFKLLSTECARDRNSRIIKIWHGGRRNASLYKETSKTSLKRAEALCWLLTFTFSWSWQEDLLSAIVWVPSSWPMKRLKTRGLATCRQERRTMPVNHRKYVPCFPILGIWISPLNTLF